MPTLEKLYLRWNDFQENIKTTFTSLRKDDYFTDVTLACKDGIQVNAHKVILAVSSPYFENMLKINKHLHPIIYMRGIKSKDLFAIIDLLYYGEANIYQDNLDNFLNIAEELKLEGLKGNLETLFNITKELKVSGKEERAEEEGEIFIYEELPSSQMVGSLPKLSFLDILKNWINRLIQWSI